MTRAFFSTIRALCLATRALFLTLPAFFLPTGPVLTTGRPLATTLFLTTGLFFGAAFVFLRAGCFLALDLACFKRRFGGVFLDALRTSFLPAFLAGRGDFLVDVFLPAFFGALSDRVRRPSAARFFGMTARFFRLDCFARAAVVAVRDRFFDFAIPFPLGFDDRR